MSAGDEGEAVSLGELLPEDKLRGSSGTRTELASGAAFDVGSVGTARGGPTAIGLHCKSQLPAAMGPAELAHLTFNDRSIPEGTRVNVLACKLGDRLVACHDGLDAVVSGSPEAFVASKIDLQVVRFGAAWNAVCLSVLAWFLLGFLPRAPGRTQPPRLDTREGGGA